MSSTDDGVVLVVGTGRRPYREYLLSSAAARHPLWIFDEVELSWQNRYVVGGTVLDFYDRKAILAAAHRLAEEAPVRGVLSWDETLIRNTAHIADELGLPGPGVNAIEGCRDKLRTRQLLAAAGVPQPAFDFVRDEHSAVEAARRIGYPVIVKPRGMAASIGVVLAADEDEVRDGFRAAAEASLSGEAAYHGALIEEYLTGPEIAIDGAVVAGEYLPMFITHKASGMFPYFEELGHIVKSKDPLLTDPQLQDMLSAAHRVIDFRYGITCIEVMFTRRGPMIIEINGRLGGDLIGRLAKFATALDTGAVAVDVALGRRPEIPRAVDDRCIGIRFAYPSQDCVVDSVSVPECRPDNGVLAAGALVEPGTRMLLPPAEFISRHAYVICAGADLADCSAMLDRALAEVRLTSHPLVASTSAASGG